MEKDAKVEETIDYRKGVELAKSVSEKHLDLLRPSARYYSIFKDREKGKYALLKDTEDYQQGIYDRPLPFYGCGVGWFSFLVGFLCPLMWYYGTILYFQKHYRKDPRERAGLGASAIAALLCTVGLMITAAIFALKFGLRP
ncbi:uncharacterized protein LOC129320454 [Prosopis cineraria]|uniref:uncharacterized protein LOC129320454 n=1 Tax=Prosopis cineraria TaxID=364024 RepID=UPI0024100D9D|nr:uncharacterized protein LOC129320454 [Prosopis cineraria]